MILGEKKTLLITYFGLQEILRVLFKEKPFNWIHLAS